MIELFLKVFRSWFKPGSSKPELLESGQFRGPLSHIPSTRNEVVAIYGHPGQFKPSKQFKRNLSVAKDLPGNWNNGKVKLYCHDLMAPYLREALRRAEEKGALEAIKRIGCYTYRHQRHDTRRPLSYHSWGIAVDVNPPHNRVVRFAPGKKPAPWSDEWMEHWPQGLSREFVESMESVGFRWGGRWKQFVDPMHFELVG